MDIDHFRTRLLALREELCAGQDSRDAWTGTVELDQSRVGRLSRMDALQGQAMARAGNARAALQLRRIDAALQRIDQGDYGDCLECGEPIAEARLRVDPAAPLCIRCAGQTDRGS